MLPNQTNPNQGNPVPAAEPSLPLQSPTPPSHSASAIPAIPQTPPSTPPQGSMAPNSVTIPSNLYPIININRPEKPNRFYAIPFLGLFIKNIMIIPVAIWLIILSYGLFFVLIINSFVVLFKGKYWMTVYNYNLGFLRLLTKIIFFMFGLTDKYPGFSRTIEDFSFDIPYPEKSSRFFAIPILGSIIRTILIIPYVIYIYVILYASYIGVFYSFFPVLFLGKYPESTFELARDSIRLYQAGGSYIMGLSDKYPSFHISWNHKIIKIILISIVLLSLIVNIFTFLNSSRNFSTTFKQPVGTLNNRFP